MIDLTMTPEQFVETFVRSKLNNGYLQAHNYDDLNNMFELFLQFIRQMKTVIDKDDYANFGVDPDDLNDLLLEKSKKYEYCWNYVGNSYVNHVW
jgi:hypothetical protein